jgi:hypothetical protein
MKIKSIAANQTEIQLNNGTIVFVSYETPIAAFIPGRGIVKTNVKYSNTTTKHVNKWIADTAPSATVSIEDQAFFNILIG